MSILNKMLLFFTSLSIHRKELIKLLCCIIFISLSFPSHAVLTRTDTLTSFVKQEYKVDPAKTTNFSDELASVPDFLKEGQTFDLSKVNDYFGELQKDFQIIEVPLWLYGTWRSDKQTQDYVQFYGKGSSAEPVITHVEIFDVVGDVVSSSKKVYSIVYPGSITSISRASNLDEYQITLKDERSNNLLGFTCSERAIRIQVESSTQTILRVYQTETEKHYRPVFTNDSMTSLYTHGWQKSFSQDGFPESLSHIKMIKTLVSKHQLVDLTQLEKADKN